MTPTERLEAAAAKLEERARFKISEAEKGRPRGLGGFADRMESEAAEARAVAATLRNTAETLACDESDYCGGLGHGSEPWNPDGTCTSWFCQSVTDCLAIAGSVGVSDKEAGNE